MTLLIDDVSFTTKFATHCRGDVTQLRDAPPYWFPSNLHPTSHLGSYAFGSGIYLIRAGGLNSPSSPIPGVGLGGLVPRTESAVLGGLPFTSADYCYFRTHGPHMRIDDLSAPSGIFVARVSAFVATVTVGCATFPFRVGFRLLSRPPCHDGSLREGFDFGFPCLRACVLLQLAFIVSPPPPRQRCAGGFRRWLVMP